MKGDYVLIGLVIMTTACTQPPIVEPTVTLQPTTTPTPEPLPTATATAKPKRKRGPWPLKLIKIKMFDELNGWAVSNKGLILRTENGMREWKDVTPYFENDRFPAYSSKNFIDANNAYLFIETSGYITPPSPLLAMFRTDDGGISWEGPIFINDPEGTAQVPGSIYKSGDLMVLMAYGNFGGGSSTTDIFTSLDDGENWKKIYYIGLSGYNKKRIPKTRMDSESFLLKYSPRLWRITKDKIYTANWIGLNSKGNVINFIVDLHFPTDFSKIKSSILYAFAPRFTSETHGYFMAQIVSEKYVSFPFPGIYGISKAQYFYFTHDNGESWQYRKAPVNDCAYFFINQSTGWCLGKNRPKKTLPAKLYFTEDEGQSWALIPTNIRLPFDGRIHFINDKAGYIIGGGFDKKFDDIEINGGLYYTTDGGYTWEEIQPEIVP